MECCLGIVLMNLFLAFLSIFFVFFYEDKGFFPISCIIKDEAASLFARGLSAPTLVNKKLRISTGKL